MHLGTQFGARTDADYETFKQLGVNHINGFPEISHQNWTSSNLKEYKEKVINDPIMICSVKVSRYKNLSAYDKFDIILNKKPKKVIIIYNLRPNFEKLYIL